MSVRLVLQGMEQASLLVDNEERWVRAGRGVVIYVSFMQLGEVKEISAALIDKAVKTIIKTKIFTHFNPERMVRGPQSLADHPHVDLVVVPQASLGGKVKGNAVQFHQLIHQNESEEAFEELCHQLRLARGVDEESVDRNGDKLPAVRLSRPDAVTEETNWMKYESRVINGTFGNRQGLRLDSDGPFAHFMDITM